MGETEAKIERNIDLLINEFKSYPEKFLTEEDVRSFLYSLLLQEFGHIETCEDSTKSVPVHCEVRWYGHGRLKLRSDIVIIDVSTLRTRKDQCFKLPTKGYGFNKPKSIIEIKLRRKSKISDKKFIASIFRDRRKLIKIRREIDAEFSSYIIVFDKRRDLRFKTQNMEGTHNEYYVFPYELA